MNFAPSPVAVPHRRAPFLPPLLAETLIMQLHHVLVTSVAAAIIQDLKKKPSPKAAMECLALYNGKAIGDHRTRGKSLNSSNCCYWNDEGIF